MILFFIFRTLPFSKEFRMSGHEAILQTLQDMGFSLNRAKRGLKATDFKVLFMLNSL